MYLKAVWKVYSSDADCRGGKYKSQGYWKAPISKMNAHIKNKRPKQPINQQNLKWICAKMYLFVSDSATLVYSNISR